MYKVLAPFLLDEMYNIGQTISDTQLWGFVYMYLANNSIEKIEEPKSEEPKSEEPKSEEKTDLKKITK